MNVPRLEWDFSECPENQLRDCHDYEFARHVERLVISARELRSMLGGMTFDQRLECLVNEENFPDMPGVPGWEEKGMFDFHYGPLWQFCAEFPSKPFLCVPPGQRETLAKEGANLERIVLPFATLLTGWPDVSMSTEDAFRLPQDPHGPQGCDFILPSVVRKGKITLAASTSGTSPALARRLREELDAYLTEDMPALADLLAEVRTEIRRLGIKVENDQWQFAIDGQLRVLLAQRRLGQARAHLVRRLGIELTPVGVGNRLDEEVEDDAVRAIERAEADAARGM